MTKTSEGLIVPHQTGLIPVEGLEFDSAIVPCSINYDKRVLQAIAQLSITADYQRRAFFGDINDPELSCTADEFVRSVGSNSDETVELVSGAIVRLTQEAAETTGDEATWLELRGGLETHPYLNVPRWHFDGTFFDPYPKKHLYKFATTLIGRGTRFGVAPDRKRFTEALYTHEDVQAISPEGVRWRTELGLADLVDEFGDEILGDGAFFLTGHKEAAAIHSEPLADGPRLFMFSLGGPLDRIQALGERRKSG